MIYVISIFIIILLIIILYILTLVEKNMTIKLSDTYISNLNGFCKIAYEHIYKDQILSYTSNASTLPDDELQTTTRNFIKLVYSLMGKNIIKYYIEFFGNNDSLNENIIIWLRNQIDNDELLQHFKNQQDETMNENDVDLGESYNE